MPSDLPFGETWAMALAPDGSVIDDFDDFNDLVIEFKDGLSEPLPRGRPMTPLLRDGTPQIRGCATAWRPFSRRGHSVVQFDLMATVRALPVSQRPTVRRAPSAL